MKIVIITEAMSTGGAETFVLRLANALRKKGLLVSIVILRGELIDCAMVNEITKDETLIPIRIPFLRLVLKLDGLLYKLGSQLSLLRWFQVSRLRKHLVAARAAVAHSHLLTADLVTSRACRSIGMPWVSTMHGDYLSIEYKGKSQSARIPDFQEVCLEVEHSLNHMVCITDPQMQQLQRLMPTLAAGGRISKIYNGYSANRASFYAADRPEVLWQIPTDAFVIGMVARGIKDKGWDVLMGAYESLGWSDAWLVLVGDGEHIQKLRDSHRQPRIIFCGNVVDPLRYIAHFDVACLPSQYTAESLPTVLIEYMLLGKPVIATDIGEVSAMLEASGNAPAGLLIELGSTSAMVTRMEAVLKKLYHDDVLRASMGANALRAAKKFDMEACVDGYLGVYAKVQT